MVQAAQEREPANTEIRAAVRHSAVYGLGNVLAKAIGFFMIPFYTHYLSPTDYGILEILDLSMSLLGMFLAMGMTAAMLRSYVAASSEPAREAVVGTALLFTAGSGIATFALMLGFLRPISATLLGPHVPAQYFLISFASFIVAYIGNVPRTYLRAREASGAFVIVDSISLILLLALNIVFIAILHLGLFGILLSSLLVASLQLTLLSLWMLHAVRLRFSLPRLRTMLAFGFPLMFSNLAIFTLHFSDRFVLQRLNGIETVGIYAVGYKFGFMLNYLIVQPFYVMWQTRMYIIHRQPDHRSIFRQIFVLYSLLLTYAGLALALFSPEIVRLMVGPQFTSSQHVVPIVTLAYIFYGIGYYVQLGMFLTDKTALIGSLGAAAAVVNLGLTYFLVLHFGMIGAAWATLLGFLGVALGGYWLSQRVLPLALGARRIAAALGLAILTYILGSRWQFDRLDFAFAIKTLWLGIFPVLLWKLRILAPAEIRVLAGARDHMVARLSPFARRWVAGRS